MNLLDGKTINEAFETILDIIEGQQKRIILLENDIKYLNKQEQKRQEKIFI
jgi:hypothetical protein